jgi:uncharacterized membrane protein
MKKYLNFPTIVALVLVVIGMVLILWFSSNNNWNNINETHAYYGAYISGVVGSLFSLVGILLLIANFHEQKEQFYIDNTENNIFSMIEIFHRFVSEHTISRTIKDKNGNKEITKSGHMIFLEMKNDYLASVREENTAKGFLRIDRTGQSYFHSCFAQLEWILEFIDDKNLKTRELQKNYIRLVINANIKFLVALYYIHQHDEESSAVKLIEKHKLIRKGEFDNFLHKNEGREDFYEKLGL